MKLSPEASLLKKIRDREICRLYLEDKSAEEIKIQGNLKLSVRRINQILCENAEFLNPRVAWPKTKRIHKRQRIASRLEGIDSRKTDETAALDALMKEIEGDKTTGSVIQNYIIIRNPEALKEEMELHGASNRIQV